MVELIRDVEAFNRLAPEWEALTTRSSVRNPFVTHAWLANWLDAFGDGCHGAILERAGGRAIAAAFVRDQGTSLSGPEAHTYWTEVLDEGDEALAALFGRLAREGGGRLSLPGSAEGAYRERLTRAAAGKFVVVPKNPWTSRAIGVEGSLSQFLSGKPPKLRAELGRKRRKLERELGPVELLDLSGAPTAPGAMAIVEQVERGSWKKDAGTAIVCSERETRFYRGVAALEARGARGRLFALAVRGEPVAYVLGLEHERSYYALKTSYLAELAGTAPGIVLLCRVIERLAEEGRISAIELLGRDARWKQELATSKRTHCSYELLPRGAWSALYSVAHEFVRPNVRRVADGVIKALSEARLFERRGGGE